jgi:hypothetical protein
MLIGKNPQTGADSQDWNCAITFLPILLVENAAMTRNVIASTDKVATEVSKVRETPVFFQLPNHGDQPPKLENIKQTEVE